MKSRSTNTATAGTIDFGAVRRSFPALQQQLRGLPLTYLDTAASAQKPDVVLDAMRRFDSHDYANVHRGLHTLSLRATEAFEAARDKVAGFMGAAKTQEIIFTSGTTAGINLVAASWARPRLKPGDEIVLSELEHHSNIVPWQLVAAECGAIIRAIPIDESGSLQMDQAARCIGERTQIVSIGAISNAIGTVNPLAELSAMAHAAGAIFVVDGAQAGPHQPIDVQSVGADFYAISSHKMYGPTGIGALYGRLELLDQMAPWQGGGEMISSVSLDHGSTFAAPPHRFEAGTPNITGAVGFGAAVDYLSSFDRGAVAAHESGLARELEQRLDGLDKVRRFGSGTDRAAIVSFAVDGIHPHDIGQALDSEGVAVRVGQHCAEPLMERLGVAATARASFGIYSNRQDVDRLVEALGGVISFFG